MHPVPGIGELCTAIKTDLMCSPLNSKHMANIVVMVPQQPTEKHFHMVGNLDRNDHTKIDRRRVVGLSRKAHTIRRRMAQGAAGAG